MIANLSTPSPLNDNEREALQFMREEEKLARDVYLTLYSLWRLPVFSNIAASEQRHTDAVQGLLQTYGIPDPVTNDRVGVFTNPELSSLYADLIARGRKSAHDALQVGALIEETDIADLQNAISKTSQGDISRVYNNLMQASHRHLRAFTGQLQSRSGAYAAQVMPQTEVDAIIGSSAYPNGGNVTRMGGGGKRMGQGRGMAAMPASHDHATVRQGNVGNGGGGWGRGHHGGGSAGHGHGGMGRNRCG
ncbi:DUF2202 domain-containing protein [Candidatus Thiothrix anitrata]|uniref:DUF2202 domain-containing protein n=1 Tax=Candidatus Thiothrix anitrata TaxID=2823902 RepID=A0ABX7X0A2_9GAMM|nr:DUF2202 domain-containing protein [Candidatus Thiothrix anitrata]QTR49295.1 DUF2202 domain-containing protein [Candidatus Thiothrix anitrata]